MANPTWPSTLPAPQADSSASFGAPNNVIETGMETGSPKRRRRFTAVEIAFTCTLKLSKTQLATLETFYYTTLAQVLPFDWTDFRTGSTATYCFTKDGYTSSYIQGSIDRWSVSMKLARKP
ncbi:hypothetical protein HFP05_05465 [Rhodanobacter denitrificans]|nr:hypothetical protein [Rhodanobacter denitrificans]